MKQPSTKTQQGADFDKGAVFDKGVYLEDLKPGDSFHDAVFAISQVQEQMRGSYCVLAMLLSDASVLGGREAACWKFTPEDHAMLRQARLIRVSGSVSSKERYRGQISIDTFQIVERPADLTPFIGALPVDHQIHKARFEAVLGSVQEPNLKQLLETIFASSAKTKAQFLKAVAARGHHHAYRGGLMEHSVEVAELCDRVCTVLPALNRDFLVTCALLHDLGKLDEMLHTLGAGDYTESGTLVGHVFSGAYRIRCTADTLPAFPETLKDAIVHLILSHHGRPEFGAARVPARAEAFVLAECDMMSARVHECVTAASASAGHFSVRLRSGDYLHVGDLGTAEVSTEVVPLYETPSNITDDVKSALGEAPSFRTKTSEEPTLTPEEAPADNLASARDLTENETAKRVFTTTACLPVRGRVAAGPPGTSSDEAEEVREVMPPQGGADYLLHVTGESMQGAGILDGDLLFVLSQAPIKNGDIVVAHIAGEGEVVKRLQQSHPAAEAWLVSENPDPAYQPILLECGSSIQGKVTGLLRDF